MRKEQILVYLIGNKYQTLKYIERLVKAGVVKITNMSIGILTTYKFVKMEQKFSTLIFNYF